MENNKTPKIRFKGFTDPWEQRKAKDLCSISTGKSNTQDRVDDGIYPFYVRSPIVEHSNRYLFDEEAVLTVGDGVGTGKVFHYVNGKYDLHQRVYRMFDFSEKITAKYFYYYFSNHFYDRVMAMTAKTSVDSVRYEMIADMDIALPEIQEQVAISDCFDNLDNLITLHQRKYNKLLNVKKSMLEKMFPKNGSNIPEIRFKGFTDPWEQRKLGDIADIVGGGTPSTNNADYWDGDIDWYAPAEIGDKIFADSSERKITKEGFENCSAKLLPAGSVLFTSRAGIGKMAILRKESCTNQGFQSIVPHEGELDSYFIFSRSDELKNYGETVGAGSTFVEVSGKQMSNMNLMMPKSYSEQIVIGKYFSQLDDLITLHQRELEKLQNIKKSMLEKMFV